MHFPLAFLTLAFGLDIFTAASPRLPVSLTSSMPPSTDLTRASYYLLSLGLLTAIPAVLTGAVETIKMISKQGMYEADGKTLKTKVKATFAHAAFNDVVLAIAGYIWYARRAQVADSLLGKLGVSGLSTADAAYAPAFWMVVAGGVAAVLQVYAASIGGTLTYNYGVGFQSLSAGKKGQ